MSDDLVVYITSVSSNMETKKHQQRIEMVLEGKKIEFKLKDIASDESVKEEMRKIAGDPKALPPQFCKGDEYLGSYEAFEEAIEAETLDEFLKL